MKSKFLLMVLVGLIVYSAGIAQTPFGAGNLVVLRVGAGSGGTYGSTTYLDEYTPAGAFVRTLQLPGNNGLSLSQIYLGTGSSSAGTSSNTNILIAGNSNEGRMCLSTNGQYLTFPGYVTSCGGLSGSSAIGIPRSIACVSFGGTYSTYTPPVIAPSATASVNAFTSLATLGYSSSTGTIATGQYVFGNGIALGTTVASTVTTVPASSLGATTSWTGGTSTATVTLPSGTNTSNGIVTGLVVTGLSNGVTNAYVSAATGSASTFIVTFTGTTTATSGALSFLPSFTLSAASTFGNGTTLTFVSPSVFSAVVTGTTTSSSTSVTGAALASGSNTPLAGTTYSVFGTNITPGTTVTNYSGGTSLTLSNSATGNGSSVMFFSTYPFFANAVSPRIAFSTDGTSNFLLSANDNTTQYYNAAGSSPSGVITGSAGSITGASVVGLAAGGSTTPTTAQYYFSYNNSIYMSSSGTSLTNRLSTISTSNSIPITAGGTTITGLTYGTNSFTPYNPSAFYILKQNGNDVMYVCEAGGSTAVTTNSTTPTGSVTSGSSSFTVTSNTGIANGQFISGNGIQANTTITISGSTVTLSKPTNAAITSTTTVTFSGQQTTTSAASSTSTITVVSKTNLAVGQVVSGTGVPANTWITSIAGASTPFTLTLSNAVSVSSGATLTFAYYGLLKYYNNAGAWTSLGGYGCSSDAYQGIVASASSNTANLYALRNVTAFTNRIGQLVSFTDNGGAAAGFNLSGNETAIVIAANNTNSTGGTFRSLCFAPQAPTATNYYYKGTGALNNVTSWGTNTDGTGNNPVNFTTDAQTFIIGGTVSVVTSSNLTGNWTVSGTGSLIQVGDGTNAASLTISSTGNSITGSFNVANNGNLINQSSTTPSLGTMSTGSTVTFAGSSVQTIPVKTYSNLSITNTGATVSAAGSITVNNIVTIADGAILDMGTNIFTPGPSMTTSNGGGGNTGTGRLRTRNTGSTALNTNSVVYAWNFSVEFAGTTDQKTCRGVQNFTNLIVNTNGTLELFTGFNVTGTLTINNGSMVSTGTNSSAITGNFTTSGTGKLNTQNASSTPLTTNRNYSFEVGYNSATGGQTIVAGNYTILNAGTFTTNTTTTGAVTSIVVADANGIQVGQSVTGTYIQSSTTVTAVTGTTITLSLASNAAPGTAIGTVTFAGSGTRTLGSGTVSVSTSFIPGSTGTYTVTSGNTLSLGYTTSLPTIGTNNPNLFNLAVTGGTVTAPSTLTIGGSFSISGGTFIAPSGNFNVAGNWSNTGGTYTHNSGTVVLNGSSQVLTGSTTFNNFTKSVVTAATLTLPAGLTQTFAGTLSLNGATGQLLTIASSTGNTVASINPTATNIYNVAVSYNTNTSGTTISATNSTDNGNNTGWAFVAASTWTGANSTNWNDANNWTPTGVPASGAVVTITTGGSNNLAIEVSPTVASLTISSGNSVTLNTGKTLTISSTISNAGSFTAASGSTVVVSGVSGVSGGGTTAFNNLTINSGASLIGGIFSISGSFTNSGTYTASGGTVTFNGTASQTVPAGTYFNLSIFNTGATVSAGGALVVLNSLNIATNAILDMGTNQLTGSFTQTSPTGGINGTTTVTLSAANSNISVGQQVFGTNITAGTTVSAYTLGSTVLTLSTAATGTSASSTTLTFGFATSGTGTIKTAYTSTLPIPANLSWSFTVDANGTGTQTIPGNSTFTNLTINNSTSIVSSGTITVNNTLTIVDGATLNMGASSFNCGTSFSTSNNSGIGTGILQTQNTGGSGAINTATVGVARTFNFTVKYNGASSQTLPQKTNTFLNLVIANSTGVSMYTGYTINGTLTIMDGCTLNTGTNGSTLSGTFATSNGGGSGTGILNLQHSSTTPITSGLTYNFGVNYSSASLQTVVAGTYSGNLTLTGGDRTLASGIISIGGVFTPGAGIINTNGGTINFNGTGAQTIPAFNYNNLTISGARTINNNVTFASGTIGIAGVFTPSATFSGTGKFDAGSSTVSFNSTTITQSIPVFNFNNLTINNTFGTTTLAGVVTANGLTLTSGVLALSTNNLTLTSGASVSVTSGSYINASSTGVLIRNNVGNVATLFPIGTSTTYTPITITNTTGTSDLSVNLQTTLANVPGDPTQVANLQWNVLGSAATTATLQFQFNGANLPVGFLTNSTCEIGTYKTSYVATACSNVGSNGTGTPLGSNPYTVSAVGFTIPTSGTNYYVVGNSGNVVVLATTWVGSAIPADNSWTNAANWSNGVPTSNVDVVIPAVGSGRYPVLSSSQSVKNLTIGSNASLTLNAANLTPTLSFTNNGTVNGSGTLITGGTVSAIAGNGTVGNITIKNNISVTGTLGITGVLTLQSGQLTTNGKLTFKSTSIANTGTLAPYNVGTNTGTINGTVTVERYIPAGYRAYRDLSSQLSGVGTIYDNWQEGGKLPSSSNYAAGYGIFITGTNAVNANAASYVVGQPSTDAISGQLASSGSGQDFSMNGNNSAYTYSYSKNPTFTPIDNTKVTLDPFVGYRVLVRGDRSFNLATTPIINYYKVGLRMVNPTVLRSIGGKLITGTVTYNTTNASGTTYDNAVITSTDAKLDGNVGAFSLVANPYVAPVQWGTGETSTNTASNSVYGASSNVNGSYWYMDPTYGDAGRYIAFNALTGAATVRTILNGDTTYKSTTSLGYIQPGQAVFVQTFAANPTVVFKETAKAVTSTKSSIFGVKVPLSKIYVSLLKQDTAAKYNRVDGAAIAFSAGFTNDAYGSQDALKFGNANDNLYITDKGKNLSIDGRLPATAADKLPIAISKVSGTNYQLVVDASNYTSNGFAPYLIDSYRGTVSTLTNGTNTITFTADANVAATYSNRFSLGFKPTTLAVNSLIASATLNNKIATISWNTVGEKGVTKFEVEKSADAKNFTKLSQSSAKNTATATYTTTESGVTATTYYRIKAISEVGTVTYSNVAKLTTNNSPLTTIYPNPLVGKVLNVSFGNISAGKYTVTFNNILGQKVQEVAISHAGGNGSHALTVNSKMAAGTYSVTVRDANGLSVYQSNLVVQP